MWLPDMTEPDKFRLDKWLWAARFFKTRSLASDAIDGGKVRLDGVRPKPGKGVRVGNELRIPPPDGGWTVIVRALSIQRRSAAEAALLYEETEESRIRRQAAQERRRAEVGERERGAGRPTKRDRRHIHRFLG